MPRPEETGIHKGDTDREFSLFGPWSSTVGTLLTFEGDGVDLAIDNTGTTTHTFTAKSRGANSSGVTVAILGAGQGVLISGRGIASVSIDSTDSNVIFRKGPRGSVRPFSTGAGSALGLAATVIVAEFAATGQTSGTMGGLGSRFHITPLKTGIVKVTMQIWASTTASGATAAVAVQAAYGTGSAPAQGAANSGTTPGAILEGLVNASAGGNITANFPLTLVLVVSGLTVGTAYWFDVQQSFTAATMGFTQVSGAVEELPQ